MDTILSADLSRNLAAQSGAKYTRLAEALEAAIASGTLAPGDKLPPVRELAFQLSVTPGTVARAYARLTDRGLLEAGVGRGTFVRGKPAAPGGLLLGEIDAVKHTEGGDVYEVNMISPHLPNVGQARLIRDLLGQIAQNPPSGVMHYPGHGTSVTARAAVVGYLSDVILGPLGPDDVVLTHGAQNGIVTIMHTVLSGRRPVVMVEELSYPGYRRAAELLRAEVVTVAMDEHGIRPDALEEVARASGAQLLCLSAEVQNPLLLTMPADRRQQIAEVARRLDFQVLEDDTYRLEQVSGPSLRAIAPDRGWYVASLSKSFSPALRIGYVVAPRLHAQKLRRAAEAGFFGMATPLSDLAQAIFEHPDTPKLQAALRAAVADRVQSMVNILGRYELTWRKDAMFVWLTLPQGWRASAFARAAEEEGVQVRTSEDYADRNARAPHAIRLAVNGGVSKASFEAALERLRVLLDNPPARITV